MKVQNGRPKAVFKVLKTRDETEGGAGKVLTVRNQPEEQRESTAAIFGSHTFSKLDICPSVFADCDLRVRQAAQMRRASSASGQTAC